MNEKETLAEAFTSICAMEAPLNVRLRAYADRLRQLAPDYAEAYDELVMRLKSADFGATSPAVGERFPHFVLPSSRGGLVALDELLGQGPVVLSFNRGHWCPLCRLELRSLAERAGDLERFHAQLVSIIPDRQVAAGRLAAEMGGKITVLSDIDNGVALTAGLVLPLGDRLTALMRSRGLHLEAFQGNDGWFVPLPATYVINRSGEVLARKADPEFRTRMEMDEIIAALEADEQRTRDASGGARRAGHE